VSMARHTHSSIDFFMGLPMGELYEWATVIGEVLKRENRE